MGKLERLAAARERVRKWKASHPKSVEWQRKRWYARKKGGRVARVKEEVEVRPSYGETHLEDPALTDGDRATVYAAAREYSRRSGRPIPAGLMEPEAGGGHGGIKSVGQGDERGVSEKDLSRPEETAEWPEEEEGRARERFQRLKGRTDLALKRPVGRCGVVVAEIVV